jgi:phage terminase large subunit
MDFGFTNDPSVVIDCALAHGELWFDELVYERGLTNTTPQDHADQPSIDGRLRDAGGDRGPSIWADSAEPKSIRDLVLAGWTVKAAEKGADSILYGINLLRKYPISITERSVNLIKDFQNYKWATDANGNPMNQPVSAWDHGPDAVRYWAMMEMEGAARPESFRLAVPAPRPWTI